VIDTAIALACWLACSAVAYGLFWLNHVVFVRTFMRRYSGSAPVYSKKDRRVALCVSLAGGPVAIVFSLVFLVCEWCHAGEDAV